jgi:hypothetical protein
MVEPPSFGLGGGLGGGRVANAQKNQKKKKRVVLALGIGVAKPLLGQMGVAKSEK